MAAAGSASSAGLLIERNEIHVWAVPLDQPCGTGTPLEGLLSSDERQRADRFVFDRDRRRYVACRTALRRALGAYLGAPAASLTFSYGERGKPALASVGRGEIEFNVSHAADLAVFAVTRGTAVGVDVESLERTVDFEGLATRFFSSDEARQLLALSPAARPAAFFNCWTRKEAYVKAIGDGLACPLDSFAVSLIDGERAAMRWIRGDDARSWRLDAFTPAAGFVGAVAVRGALDVIRLRYWTELNEPHSGADLARGQE